MDLITQEMFLYFGTLACNQSLHESNVVKISERLAVSYENIA